MAETTRLDELAEKLGVFAVLPAIFKGAVLTSTDSHLSYSLLDILEALSKEDAD